MIWPVPRHTCRCQCHAGATHWPFDAPHRADPVACLESCDLCAPLHPMRLVPTPPRRPRPTRQADGEGPE